MNLTGQIIVAIGVAAVATVADGGVPKVETMPSSIAQVMSLIERFGVMAVLLVYFVIRDFIRYRADQAEKAEYRKKLDDLDKHIQGDHKALIAKQGKEITRARQTHDVLITTLKDYEPTEVAIKALEASRNATQSSDTRIEAVKH